MININNEKLTKQDVKDTFKKLGIKNDKSNTNELEKWIDRSNNFPSKNKDIWVVTDSSTSFINLIN